MFVKLAEYMKPARALGRPHKGIVVDNEDPEKLGRVKCTVAKLFEGDVANLPWIFSKHLDPAKLDVPELGQELIIEFPYGDIYAPFYTGFWNNTPNINAVFDTNYPKTFGFSKGGLHVTHNKETNLSSLIHPSGTSASIKDDGTLELVLTKDLTLLITGDYSIGVDGKIDFTATGDITLNTDGKLSSEAAGGIDLSTDADAKLIGKGSTTVGDSGGATKVDGATVLLAGGGLPVALFTSQVLGSGLGNLAIPIIVTGMVMEGSAKVLAPK